MVLSVAQRTSSDYHAPLVACASIGEAVEGGATENRCKRLPHRQPTGTGRSGPTPRPVWRRVLDRWSEMAGTDIYGEIAGSSVGRRPGQPPRGIGSSGLAAMPATPGMMRSGAAQRTALISTRTISGW